VVEASSGAGLLSGIIYDEAEQPGDGDRAIDEMRDAGAALE